MFIRIFLKLTKNMICWKQMKKKAKAEIRFSKFLLKLKKDYKDFFLFHRKISKDTD